MVEIVDPARHGGTDAGRTLQVHQRRRAHLARRAEVQQQGALARRPDARNFVERACLDGAATLGSVRADARP